jgi:hypothetical protein
MVFTTNSSQVAFADVLEAELFFKRGHGFGTLLSASYTRSSFILFALVVTFQNSRRE